MRTLLHSFDTTVTRYVMTLFPASLKPTFLVITALGDPIVTIAIGIGIMAFGLWQDMRLFWAGLMVPAVLIVGSILKVIFERMRPLSEYAANMRVDTYSFPSGHSSGSMIAYGLLAYIALMKLPAPYSYIAALSLMAIPIAIGISRIYLSAHYPSDVIAGWLLGLVGLGIVIWIIRPFA